MTTSTDWESKYNALHADFVRLREAAGSDTLDGALTKSYALAASSSGKQYFNIDWFALPEDDPRCVANPHGLRTVTEESMATGAAQLQVNIACGLSYYQHQPHLGPEDDPTAYKWHAKYVNEKFAKLMGAPSAAVALAAMCNTVNANLALRNNQVGLLKTWLRGEYIPVMTRNLIYHTNKPSAVSCMWFQPVIFLQADGTICRMGSVHYTSREETEARLYETVMHDHLGLKFTPAIVSCVDQDGNFLYQNSSSSAAFGIQGLLHRREGAAQGFNLFHVLFEHEQLALKEMRAVTEEGNMFSRVLKLRSPILHEVLSTGGRAVWHQVQISRARDPVSMQMVYVVAQLDVTSAVLVEHKVVELQAENTDLHYTRAKLEDEKAHAEEMNQRLKETLVEALAQRDKHLGTTTALIDTDSPADKVIKLLNKILEGQEVRPGEALEVRDLVVSSASELLQPVHFRQQMGARMGRGLDEEVGRSLMDMLVANRDAETWEVETEGPDTGISSSLLNSIMDADITLLDPDTTGSDDMGPMERGISRSITDTLGPGTSSRFQRTPRSSLEGGGRQAMLQQLVVSHLQQRGVSNAGSSPILDNLVAQVEEKQYQRERERERLNGHGLGTSSSSTSSLNLPANFFQQLTVQPNPQASSSPNGSSGFQQVPHSPVENGHAFQHMGVGRQAAQQAGTGPSASQPPVGIVAIRQLLSVIRSPSDALARVLASADDWGWDPFQLAEATGGRPLSAITYSLLKRHHSEALKACHVDEVRLCRFLVKLEEGYPDNPYHNRTHAADVLHSMHVLFTRGGLRRALHVGEAGALAVYLAAAAHDVGHKGLNNDYLVRSGDSLALLYNDLSPMENHHLAYTFQLLAQEPYNFLQRSSTKVKETIRKLVIQLVLATDMKQHFMQTSLFKAKLHVDESTSSATNSGEINPACTLPASLLADDEIKTLSLVVGLKCADLGHLCAPNTVHLRWVALLEEELFQQGDLEKAQGLAVSALMDRSKAGITKSQTGFFGVVALPLFQNYAKVFTHMSPMLDGLTANYQHWLEVEQQGK